MRSPWAGSEDTTPAFTSGAGRDWRAARFTPENSQNRESSGGHHAEDHGITGGSATCANHRKRESCSAAAAAQPGAADARASDAPRGVVGRHGHRDRTLVLLAYPHGLRVSELVALRWEQIDHRQGLLHVNRRKNGVASTHPLRGVELRVAFQPFWSTECSIGQSLKLPTWLREICSLASAHARRDQCMSPDEPRRAAMC